MLTFYKPKLEELWFKETLLSDKETMLYNHAYGGTISFPSSLWQEWYRLWVDNNDNARYYRYLKNDDGVFVGEVSYHCNDKIDAYICDVLIFSKYRNKGYGGEALDMLCLIAKENGISSLCDEIAIDNSIALKLFFKHKFVEVSRNENTVLVKKLLR